MKPSMKHAVLYSSVTLALSYLVFWGPLAFFKIPTINFINNSKGPIWAIILYIIGGFVPSITGITLSRITDGPDGLRKLLRSSVKFRIGMKWYSLIILLIILGGLLQIVLNILLGYAFNMSLFLKQLPSFFPLLVLGPLSEEFGWRGYLLGKLKDTLGFVSSSIYVGILWSLWHLPLFFMLGTSQHELHIPFLGFALTITSLSIVMTWINDKTHNALWAAIFFHWIYTYVMQVVSTGVTYSRLYSWLEPLPFIAIAVMIVSYEKTLGKRKSI